MADLNSTINDIVVGDSYDIIRDVTEIPQSQYLVEAWMTVKENHWDATPVFSKIITDTVSGGGLIEDTGTGDTIGKIRFTLNPADTVLLKPYYSYVYDIQVRTNINKIYTAESGLLTPHHEVTTDS